MDSFIKVGFANMILKSFRRYATIKKYGFGCRKYSRGKPKGGFIMLDAINFFNALFNYGICAIGLIAVIVLAVFSGKKLRDRNDQKKNGILN